MSTFVRATLLACLPFFVLGCPQGAGPSRSIEDADVEDDAGDAHVADVTAADAEASDGSLEEPKKTSALCGVNGQNACGAFLVCDPKLGCVECVADDDCPASSPHCLAGSCVECRPSLGVVDGGVTDCPGTGRTCWASDDSCHDACSAASPCPSGTRCDATSGACVGCATDADCPSGVCSLLRSRCVECNADSDCPTPHPRCRLATAACVQCTSNDDCGRAAPVCDPSTFTCRVGCWSDAQCPGQTCDLTTARCVTTTTTDAATRD